MRKEEVSAAGSIIYRHESQDSPPVPAKEDADYLALVTQHVETHIGPVQNVFHEIVSEHVHLDILIVAPTPSRNFYTLVTCGMGLRPMTVPKGAEAYRYAELLLCLPSNWPLSEAAFRDEDHYWPVRMLKSLARLPHQYNTWLYLAHTIPNGDPAEPYADNTKLSGMILSVPSTVSSAKEFFTLAAAPGKDVHFFSLLPLYKEEMDFKLKQGPEALFEKLEAAGVNELLRADRKNVCKKRFGLF
ncbi:suppressor of fused domain protein [Cohnella sp. GCM10012308]|uniref:suppressor of fused domain protein n=1 Tax=Cohnella sp. GCM10012308 TaxID=3317329 RepID=UPI00360F73C7